MLGSLFFTGPLLADLIFRQLQNISVLNAEASFLPELLSLHARFPNLRIVLEHATSAAAVEAVLQCGPSVGCTITVHHLALTVDNWAGQPLNFCKPVAKLASDRKALRSIIASGNPKFFLGSDSAPHPLKKKMPSAHDHVHNEMESAKASTSTSPQDPSEPHYTECPSCAAGIYASSEILPLLADIFEDEELEPKIPLEGLKDFASTFGREFYREPIQPGEKDVTIVKSDRTRRIPAAYPYTADDGQQEYIRPFYAGKSVHWSIQK